VGFVYRAVDQHGQVIDVLVAARRDGNAARRFVRRAITTSKVRPSEVVTDKAPVYPRVLDELVPAAWHRVEQYQNIRVEADHGRLKHRLRPMRGLRIDRAAAVITAREHPERAHRGASEHQSGRHGSAHRGWRGVAHSCSAPSVDRRRKGGRARRPPLPWHLLQYADATACALNVGRRKCRLMRGVVLRRG